MTTIRPGHIVEEGQFDLARRLQDAGATFEIYNGPTNGWSGLGGRRVGLDFKAQHPYRRVPGDPIIEEDIEPGYVLETVEEFRVASRMQEKGVPLEWKMGHGEWNPSRVPVGSHSPVATSVRRAPEEPTREEKLAEKIAEVIEDETGAWSDVLKSAIAEVLRGELE